MDDEKMRLTLEQDYAVRILYELCRNSDGFLDVGQLSDKTGVTPLFTQKIMRKLLATGFIESKKGVYGGYKLREGISSKDISLYDVFKATDDELFINHCLSGNYSCTRPEVIENNGECYIQKSLRLLNDNLIEAMKGITFDKIIN